MKFINSCLAVSLALGLSVATNGAEVLMKQSNGVDFWGGGSWAGYGKGSAWATQWSQFNGHGYWESPDRIVSGNVYVIPSGLTLTTPLSTQAQTFDGDSLILDGGTLRSLASGSFAVNFGLLEFRKNAEMIHGAGHHTDNDIGLYETTHRTIISCPVKLNSSTVSVGSGNNYTVGFRFTSSLSGTAESSFAMVKPTNRTGTGAADTWFKNNVNSDWSGFKAIEARPRLELLGDTTEFYGTIAMCDRTRLVIGAHGLANVGNRVVLPSTTAKEGAVIGASTSGLASEIRELDLGANTYLHVPVSGDASGLLRVTSEFGQKGTVSVILSELPSAVNSQWRIPVLKVNRSAGVLNESMFALLGVENRTDGRYDVCADFSGFDVEEEDGVQTLYCFGCPTVTMESNSYSLRPADWPDLKADDSGNLIWSDGQGVHGGCQYVVDNKDFSLRMPGSSASGENEFPGCALCVNSGSYCLFSWSHNDYVSTIRDFRLSSGAKLVNWAGDSQSGVTAFATIDGKLTISGSVDFRSDNNRSKGICVKSRLVGNSSAAILVNGPSNIDSAAADGLKRGQRFVLKFTGDQSAFFGKIQPSSNTILYTGSFGGTLNVKNGAIVSANDVDVVTVPSGTFAAGTELQVPTDISAGTAAKFVFADDFSVVDTGKLIIRPQGIVPRGSIPKLSAVIADIPSSSSVTLDSFSLDLGGLTGLTKGKCVELNLEEGEMGRKLLKLEIKSLGMILVVR